MRKKYKLINTRIGTASVNPMMKYPACEISIDRRGSRAASIRSMKGKFEVETNTACSKAESKLKQAMDDVKRKDLPDPYAYSSWTRNVMRKRRRTSFTRRLKNVVKGRDSTERRVQALEVRFLRNLRNKNVLCKHTSSEMTVEQRSCKQAWKRRQKQCGACLLRESYWKKRQKLLNVYVNNGSTATKSCLRRGGGIVPTHPHQRREKRFNTYLLQGGRQKGRCDTFLTHSHRKRQRMVINLGSVQCTTLCISVTETTNGLLSKCVTQTPRSNTLLFTNKNACVSNGTMLAGHATMSSQT